MIGQRKIDLIDAVCAPGVVNWAALPERRYGIEETKKIARFIFGARPDQHWLERRMIVEGDFVVAHGIPESTWHGGSFRGVATFNAAGQQIAVELVHIFRRQAGKIVEHSGRRLNRGRWTDASRRVQP